MTLTAPYNFVPLAKKVVRPYWASAISHDLPFKDGLSGSFEIVITAKSPMYVRNGGSKGSEFSRTPDNRLFLPGSTIKGAIANVLRIMSFGDLAANMGNTKYTGRDVQNKKIDYYPLATIREFHKAGEPDLAECMFGFVQDKMRRSAYEHLKGRVMMGHAYCINEARNLQEKNEVLNSPKPTYYPTYIRQKVRKDGTVSEYKTLFDKKAVVSGWKRYPVHSGRIEHNTPPNDNTKLLTCFTPVDAGVAFHSTIVYHNLRPAELGALLSAITFHNSPDCFHSIGMAKPLGYGKVSITIDRTGEARQLECMQAFEAYMESELKDCGGWIKSDQITALLTMATEQQNEGNSELRYMPDVKDFAKAKKEMLALDIYSNLHGIQPKTATSLFADTATRQQLSESFLTEKARATKADNKSYEQRFEEKKNTVLEALKTKRKAQGQKEEEVRLILEQEQQQQAKEAAEKERSAALKAQRIQEEQHKPFEILVDPAKKTQAWEDAKKIIKVRKRNLGIKDDDPLPKSDHEKVVSVVLSIATFLKDSDYKKWRDEPHFIAQLSGILGEAKAKEVHEQVKNVPRNP